MNTSMNGSRFQISRTIGGRKFDTKTASWVMHIPCHEYYEDFKWENTDLYRSPKGQWFLAGEGKAATRWRRKETDGIYSGEGIQLLSESEAKSLIEKFNGPYEIYFVAEEG